MYLFSLIVASTFLPGAPPEKKATPAPPFIGEWVVKDAFLGKQKFPDGLKMTYIIGKDSIVILTEANGKSDVETFPYKFNTQKTPWELDFTVKYTDAGFHTFLGIVEIKDNEMKLCYNHPLAEKQVRPKTFNTENGNTLIIMKRIK
ncbi:MAG: hypothetical protein R3B84_00145 [Zavarzinella sp.]